MTYLQITTHCNMKCDHCCMSCEPGKGVHMSMKTLKNALQFIIGRDDSFTIGGGEPTVHPKFEEIFFKCLAAGMESGVGSYIITNGKHTKRALMIARFAKAMDGMFDAELSLDWYHEPIDDCVINAFGENIRNVSGKVIMSGRAEETMTYDREEGCACETIMIKPDGSIMTCGCSKAILLGNVNDKNLNMNGLYNPGYCTSKLFPNGKIETTCPNCNTESLTLIEMEDPSVYYCNICKEDVVVESNAEMELTAC